MIIPRFIAYDEDGQVEFDWVEDVGDFENCSFNTLVIPKSVRRIDDYFLTKDSKLREIIVEEGNPVFHVDEDGRLCDEKGPIEFEYYDE